MREGGGKREWAVVCLSLCLCACLLAHVHDRTGDPHPTSNHHKPEPHKEVILQSNSDVGF